MTCLQPWGRKDIKLSRLERRSKWLDLRTKGDGRRGEAEGSQISGAWECYFESLESQRGKEVINHACILERSVWGHRGQTGQGGEQRVGAGGPARIGAGAVGTG